MIQVKIEANGVSVDDAIVALMEAKRRIRHGCTTGCDSNEISSFSFSVDGEEEPMDGDDK